jgi:CheY-like chemotaxis protein
LVLRDLLLRDFENVLASLEDTAAKTFQTATPHVLILAFSKLAECERQYLALWRSAKEPLPPHRAVVLCKTAEVRQAYALCKRGIFDDYVQYWPMSLDPMRLLMSIHLAYRGLNEETSERAVVDDSFKMMNNSPRSQGTASRESASTPLASDSKTVMAADVELQAVVSRIVRAASSIAGDRLGRESPNALAEGEVAEDAHAELHDAIESLKTLSAEPARIHDRQMTQSRNSSGRQPSQLDGRIVLIVDDDPFQREVVAAILRNHGCSLAFAKNGVEAIEVLQNTKPDLILLDVMMPEMDGSETIRRVKAFPQWADIPILMMAGDSRQNIVTTTIGAGAKDFLVKPIVATTLIEKVRRALNLAV